MSGRGMCAVGLLHEGVRESHLRGPQNKSMDLKYLFNENFSSIKRTQSETKYTLTEIKDNLQGSNSRMDEAENQINDLEHKAPKNKHAEQEEKKTTKNKII